jgi:hypothetical protein
VRHHYMVYEQPKLAYLSFLKDSVEVQQNQNKIVLGGVLSRKKKKKRN